MNRQLTFIHVSSFIKTPVGGLRAMKILEEIEWTNRMDQQRKLVEPFIEDFQSRRQKNIKHPVYDFLFDYYKTKRNRLLTWRPKFGVALIGPQAKAYLEDHRYCQTNGQIHLNPDAIDEKLLARLDWISTLLTSSLQRTPRFTCYGLHEWAMMYKTNEIRHTQTPLRVDVQTITDVVESNTIQCTHYDAFRFFTNAATPLNRNCPTLETRDTHEQFGCVHFNMDLYKWCYKLAPWISSELTVECFLLAIRARELDMKASPYDCTAYGLNSIPIETELGKKRYQFLQKEISNKGMILGKALLSEIQMIQHSKC